MKRSVLRPSFSASFLTAAALAAALIHTDAAVIGTDSFSYADGAIAGQTGGTGFANQRTAEPGSAPQSPSDWDNVSGTPSVTGGLLITNGSSAKREYGGATEGSAAGSNEREGAIRGAGTLFFSAVFQVDALLPAGTNQWGGMSSYDFASERLFFGMPGQTTETRFFGLSQSGVATSLSTIPVQANTAYRLLAMVDFDADRIALWVNPDGSDTVTSYDASLTYTATNWASAVRLGSVAGANVGWDDLRVADTFAEAIPESSTAALALAGLATLAGRCRRRKRVS